MIKSMTGYGGAKGKSEGMELSVELKSVNNRYLDCNVRLPRNFIFAEEAVKSVVSEEISRGKVDVYVTVDYTGADSVAILVNDALATGYADAVGKISHSLGLPDGLSAYAISRLPDVVTVERREADRDVFSKALLAILREAISEHNAMRETEGEKLCDDISGRLDTIESLVARVEVRSPETVTQYRQKLYKKMTEILENTAIDEQRILTEAAIFADRTAVDEETVRLKSHIRQLRQMLSEGSPIGRKMDFLVQEFNREANTIGSKCNDSELSKTVIELKSEIEKIREQVQNIE